MVEAGEKGAQPWVFALAARLSSTVGQAEMGRKILLQALELKPNKEDEARIRKRLSEIERELANESVQ